MSGPGSDVSGELSDYLEQKGVNVLFLELVEYLLAERPSNPVQFILSHLVKHYPDMCQIPRVIGFETEEVLYERDDKQEEDGDDEDDERRDKPIHRRSRNRRHAFSAPSVEPEDMDNHFRRRRVPKSPEDKAMLKKFCRSLPLFADVPAEQLEQIVMAMVPSSPEKGKVIYTQGQTDGTTMYFVVAGQVNLHQTKGERKLETIMPVRRGQYFGAHQMLYSVPREHTARAATEDVKLWSLDRITCKLSTMEFALTTRQRRVEFLINIPIFATLTELERLALADALEVVNFSDNEVILRQNDPARHMYIVEAGRVAIMQQITPVSAPSELCRLSPGSYFGEMALLTDRPRMASALSVGDSRLLSLNRTTLRRILGPFSDVLKRDKGLYSTFMAQKI